jgi:hypothetical protein
MLAYSAMMKRTDVSLKDVDSEELMKENDRADHYETTA